MSAVRSETRAVRSFRNGPCAVVYRPFCVRRLSNYVIASYIIGKYNIARYNVKEAEGPSCVVGDGALPDRVVFSICG